MKVTNHESIVEKPVVNKQIIAYFDHEFERPTAKKIDADFNELVDNGFTHVVLTMSEGDIASPRRMQTVKTLATEASARGLEVWLNAWGVAGMFGGEARSYHYESGEPGCFCNDKACAVGHHWLRSAEEVGVDTVFLDEPEMRCDEHHDKGYELSFLERYTMAAGQLGLACVVVLPADERRTQQLIDVAALPDVAEIATDAYYQNAFKNIKEADRLAYVAKWAIRTKKAADMSGKASHGWAQSFGIQKGNEMMIGEHITIIKRILGSLGVWGHHGCESIAENVPGFQKPGTLSPMQHWDATLRPLRKLREAKGELAA